MTALQRKELAVDGSAGAFGIDSDERERLWEVIARVRDASSRQTGDAETDDIVDELCPVLGEIAARRTAANSAAVDVAWHDAGLELWRAWTRFAEARTPVEAAEAITGMSNAVTDLATFLPGYDYNSGTIVDEDEKEESGDRVAGPS